MWLWTVLLARVEGERRGQPAPAPEPEPEPAPAPAWSAPAGFITP